MKTMENTNTGYNYANPHSMKLGSLPLNTYQCLPELQ